LWEALKPLAAAFTLRFAANVDGSEIAAALEGLDPARTLVTVVSKTFTTQETMANAQAARAWLRAALGEAGDAHLLAVSANPAAVAAFGVSPERLFAFRDWVGGRYSLWSAVSLSCAIALGWDVFEAFLEGGAAMDRHFLEAPLEASAPVLLALAQAFNRNGLNRGARAVIPYSQRLRLLPAFLQQLEMESNGKSVSPSGRPAPHATAPVVFGEPGTNAQHAFFQMLHQGADVVPVEFIGVARNREGPAGAHAKLLSNLLAQAEALMVGRAEAEVRAELAAKGWAPAAMDGLAPQRAFAGNRPSSLIVMDELTPQALGALIALYEHKTFVEGVLWEINSFDQWGVELGKALANRILPELQGGPALPHDPSTAAWIARLRV
jgi:glucose-6-phosphate isomerase